MEVMMQITIMVVILALKIMAAIALGMIKIKNVYYSEIVIQLRIVKTWELIIHQQPENIYVHCNKHI